MNVCSNKDSMLLADFLYTLEEGQYRDRKDYLKELHDKGCIRYKCYTIYRENYCYTIWKDTDEELNPEFKGHQLLKVIPRTCIRYYNKDRIVQLLDLVYWTYI